MKKISILGSTGSIGQNTLDVMTSLNGNFSLFGISCNNNLDLLLTQINKYKPRVAVITNLDKYNLFIKNHGNKLKDTEILFGSDGLEEICSNDDVDIVVASIVGFECLKPVMSAIKTNKTILAANKEILVSAGDVIRDSILKSNALLLPIDSEHNAILQIILSSGLDLKIFHNDYYKSKINKLTITASGGPFLDYKLTDLQKVTPKEAVMHPTWKMGEKISVDSSTMMNKGLEIIEAKLLFNLDLSNIDAVIHRQSQVHALVDFFDGTTIAHFSQPDMRIPISYALTFPDRLYTGSSGSFDFSNLTFEAIPINKFPCYQIARDVAEVGKNSGLILNAANEISVEYFLKGMIKFTDISNIINSVLDQNELCSHTNIKSIIDNDISVRKLTKEIISKKYGIN